ncbi:Crp/Fnr family transcriptional regulator [Pedobacter psychrodurus]|uniref:Crp/Fnr family transcriptional regulator n=1 Tax=Pedobacter psychrodurus TaxID=2530456 RepID=A0A4R0PZS3_9SPHI|nr:Crp/Fnr family transcriptional regulator [Pedobacter psychrodurus]TCD28770.1 Crp/Fnr family transcriptional regulator [Pedobacter psychrodurus]
MKIQPYMLLALRRNIENVVKLTDGEFDQIASRFTPKLIRKNQFLLEEQDKCKHDYFVIKGALRQYRMHDTKEWVNQFAFEGWWISDWYSMLNNTPSDFYIDALENSEVLQVNKKALDSLFDQIVKFDKFYRVMFQRAFSAQQKRIAFMQKSAESRYEEFVSMYGRFETHVSQAQIASYLGITRESLSRIKNLGIKRLIDQK